MGNVNMEATQINYRGGSKKMSVEEAIKAAGTEITPEEKTWIDSIPTLASGKADNDVIAPEFDSEAGVYAIGDLVMHEGKLYEFTTAHETAGEWDSTEVTEKTVSDEIDSVKSGLNDKANRIDTFNCHFGVSQDGQHYVFDMSHFSCPSNRYACLLVTSTQDNDGHVIPGFVGSTGFDFTSQDVTWDSVNKTITVDIGAGGWCMPFLLIPNGII